MAPACPPSPTLPLPSLERVGNRDRGAGRAGGPGTAPESRAAGGAFPALLCSGALPDPSGPRVTHVVIPSVGFELIHFGLLFPLDLLYTLSLDSFFPSPVLVRKIIASPLLESEK